MSDATKTILAFTSLLMIGVAVVLFSPIAYRSGTAPATAIVVRTALLGIGVPMLALVIWSFFRKDKCPDLLRVIYPRPYERSGLCFVPVIELLERVAHLTVYFQNRYEGRCFATIRIISTKPAINPQTVEFMCDGAEFGILRRPIQLPAHLLGQTVEFEVLAQNQYPEGHGRLMRFRDGIPVDNLEKQQRAVRTVIFAFIGQFHFSRPASVCLQLPSESEQFDAVGENIDVIESVWKLGDPV